MDTKLKSNNKIKYIVTAIVAVVLLITSFGLVSSYPAIEKEVKKDRYNKFEQSEFTEMLNASTIAIYSNLVNQRDKKEVNPSDYLGDQTGYEGEALKEYKTGIDESVREYKRALTDDMRNLQYYVVDTKTNTKAKYATNNIEGLLGNKIEQRLLDTLQGTYSFYAVLDFAPGGRMSVTSSYGVDRAQMERSLINLKRDGQNGISNIKIVFAVQKNLAYSDNISEYITRSAKYNYNDTSQKFCIITLIVVIAFALIFPYKRAKETLGFKTLSKIPFEINIVAMMILFIVNITEPIMINATLDGSLDEVAHTFFTNYAREITIATNIVYWFIMAYIAFLYIVYIKHIFTGFANFFRSNSLIYKFIVPIRRFIKGTIKYIGEIDLKDKNTKKLVLALGINFIVIIAICSIWFLGFIFAVIYTVVLYMLARRHLDSIRKGYKNLLDATNKIADGNLDVKINEDLGIFEPFKEKIESIQTGFKKSVEEEVKSQRMKTELISNVSHDLKTPLTSIITYVDLLKDKSLPEEKREEYLEVLDKKSQRLQYLIEDLFEVSKATSGNVNLNIVDVDVVSLMKQTLLELDDKITNANLIIRTNFPSGKAILPLDSQRMYRVFDNLVINITKYAMEGSRVYINIEDFKEETKIILKNMAGSEIDFKSEDIMERFARGDRSRNTEGSGLGLSIAKSFVELQGGKFEIKIDGDLFKVVITFKK